MHLELKEIETLLAKKEYAQALPKLNKLLVFHPTAYLAYKYRGICKHKLFNDWNGAAMDYEYFIKFSPFLEDTTDYISDTFEMEDLLTYSDEGVHSYQHILAQLSMKDNPEEYLFFHELCIPFKISHLKLQYNSFALTLEDAKELEEIKPFLSPTFKRILAGNQFVPSYRMDYYTAFPDVCLWSTFGTGREYAQNYVADLMGADLWNDISIDGFLKVKHFKEIVKHYHRMQTPYLECRNSVWRE